MTRYWARLSGGGFWGWTIEILSCGEDPLSLTMVEQPTRSAWTERGARRKAARLIRRRIAQDRRAAKTRIVTVP